jgi:hypothetical protein
LLPSFEAFVRKWGGSDAIALLDFQENMAAAFAGYHSIRPFIKADNPSMPNETTHSKSLMMHTLLSNPTVLKIDKVKLLATRQKMMADVYYQERFSNVVSALP